MIFVNFVFNGIRTYYMKELELEELKPNAPNVG